MVYATGKGTYYGKTAALVESAETRSHLQRAVIKIADYLLIIAAALAILIVGVAFHRHDPILVVLQFELVMTVAAVPVAMPAVLSVTMALGARVLTLKQAIVTKLSSVEEVAGIDVLCSDKTGTLTQSKLTPGAPFTVDDFTPEQVILSAALLGGPVSTTQVVSSSIMGTGSAQRVSKVRWGVAVEILTAWILTIPVAALGAALLYYPLNHLLGGT